MNITIIRQFCTDPSWNESQYAHLVFGELTPCFVDFAIVSVVHAIFLVFAAVRAHQLLRRSSYESSLNSLFSPPTRPHPPAASSMLHPLDPCITAHTSDQGRCSISFQAIISRFPLLLSTTLCSSIRHLSHLFFSVSATADFTC